MTMTLIFIGGGMGSLLRYYIGLLLSGARGALSMGHIVR